MPFGLFDLGGRIGQHHLQRAAVGRQLEPAAAHGQDLRVELNGRGLGAQLFVAELGDGRRTQAQLHGVHSGHFSGVGKQQPAHHALHIFQVDIKRVANAHGALHPGRSQVQIAHVTIVRDADFGQLRRNLCVFVLRRLGAATGFTNHVSHQYSEQALGGQSLAPCLQFFLE